MKILIVSDSFKDSLSSFEVGNILKGVLGKENEVEVVSISDGGEGALESISSSNIFELESSKILDPLGREISAEFGISKNSSSAFIEMAKASGLDLLSLEERNAKSTSSFGLGMLIKYVASKGVKDIILSIGGSATVDCGAGMLRALGAKYSGVDKDLVANSDLQNIDSLDVSGLKFSDLKFKVLADVDNVLLGENGSVYTYAKQKGAKDSELEEMEDNMLHFASLCTSVSKKDFSSLKGSGAAGGIAFALMNFYRTEIVSGSEYFIDQLKIVEKIKNADIVISGEGSLDSQSYNSKIVSKIAQLCESENTKLILLAGKVEENFSISRDKMKYHNLYELSKYAKSIEDSLANASIYLKLIAEKIRDELR